MEPSCTLDTLLEGYERSLLEPSAREEWGHVLQNGTHLLGRMHNPPHPGLTLRDDVLRALGLNVTEAARQLDISRVLLSRVLNGRAAISPEMALRLEAWLGKERGGDARLWLAQQNAYDMWQAAQRLKESRTHVQPAPLAVENP